MAAAALPPPARDAAAYRFWVDEHARFADLDLLGHVNNVAFAVYAEYARSMFLHQTGLWVPQALRQSVVARIEIDYRQELLFPAQVRIGLLVRAIGRTSFTLDTCVFQDGGCISTCRATLVRRDGVHPGAAPLNDDERSALQPWLAEAT